MDEPPLRVRVQRTGGFANRVLRADLDSATLPPEQAAELTRLTGRVDFAGLAERAAAQGGGRGADRFQYDVSVEQGELRHHLQLAEGAVPEELTALLDHVLASRTRGRSPAGP